MKRTIQYLRPLIEPEHAKPSLRRIIAIGFLIGMIRYVEHSMTQQCQPNSETLWAFGSLICIMLGITTMQTIVQHINNKQNDAGTP